MSDCTGCQNTQVLIKLTEILWDHTFLSDVPGCRKTQVSDCTSSTLHVCTRPDAIKMKNKKNTIVGTVGFFPVIILLNFVIFYMFVSIVDVQ